MSINEREKKNKKTEGTGACFFFIRVKIVYKNEDIARQ